MNKTQENKMEIKIDKKEFNVMKVLSMAIMLMRVPTWKRKRVKLYSSTWDDLDEGYDDDSNNFIVFIASIISTDSSYENISEISGSEDEGYKSDANENIHETYISCLKYLRFE